MIASVFEVAQGKIETARGAACYSIPNIGSGIGIFALDPTTNVAGAVHISLPGSGSDENPGRFAATAVPAFFDLLQRLGADPNSIKVAIFGGSEVMGNATALDGKVSFGERNASSVRNELSKIGVEPVFEHIGGCISRSISLDSATGEITSAVGSKSVVVCRLREVEL